MDRNSRDNQNYEKVLLTRESIITLFLNQWMIAVYFKGINGIDVERMNRINYENYNRFFSNTCQYIINIVKECNHKMFNNLLNWEGVKKSKKDTTTFKAYFKIARNTFDQRKISIIAHSLCTPIINRIIEVLHVFFCLIF